MAVIGSNNITTSFSMGLLINYALCLWETSFFSIRVCCTALTLCCLCRASGGLFVSFDGYRGWLMQLGLYSCDRRLYPGAFFYMF